MICAVCRQVGEVATNYHAVSLKIKSVLDSTNAECGDEVADEGRDSTVAGMDTTDDESQVCFMLLLGPFFFPEPVIETPADCWILCRKVRN